MYPFLFKHLFVRMDPEIAHERVARVLRLAAGVGPVRWALQSTVGRLPEGGPVVFGREFRGLLGVAAGFDKGAQLVPALRMLGFGYVEIGTITAKPQPGNEGKRLWRLVEAKALRNRMGFNNVGASEAGRRLAKLRSTRAGQDLIIGVNIGKSKVTPLEGAAEDYAYSARELGRYADYVVVNVSSPNTPGLRDLQAVQSLRPILEAVRGELPDGVALLVKIAPDLSDDDVREVAALVLELGLEGVVATNTTIAHDLGEGGVSGPPVRERALEVVALLRRELGPEPVIIGVGGISSTADARALLAAGANLLQGYTAFIYHGPAWAGRINRALAR